MNYIAIAGQAQNGKDTVADYLAQSLNERDDNDSPWVRTAFAKSVKRIYCDIFKKDLDFIEQWKTCPEPPPGMDMAVRQSLQFIGDGFRKIQSKVWINETLSGPERKIISDARYINELMGVQQRGGFNILVIRPNMLNTDPCGSERQMRQFADFVLRNNPEFKSDSTFRRFKKFVCGLCRDDSLPPPGWEYINSVIINDGTISDLYRKIDQLLPIINNHFNTKDHNG